jgi:hypothetical protein
MMPGIDQKVDSPVFQCNESDNPCPIVVLQVLLRSPECADLTGVEPLHPI